MKFFRSAIFSAALAVLAGIIVAAPTYAEETLSISVDGSAEIVLSPNTVETGSVDVFVSSSSRDGYTLSVSDADNDNSLKSSSGSISPLSGAKTIEDFETNAWGVKVGDQYLPVPTLGSNLLKIVSTSKAATKLGFDLTSKGVQTGVRLIAGSPVSAANMMTYTAITEIGGTSLYYGAERMGVIKPEHGEYMSVMNPDFVGKHSSFFEGDNDFLRITVDLIKQGAMGSVAPFIGAFANKTGRTRHDYCGD